MSNKDRATLLKRHGEVMKEIRSINRQLSAVSAKPCDAGWASRAIRARDAKVEHAQYLERELGKLKDMYHQQVNAAFVARCRATLPEEVFDSLYAWALNATSGM